MQPHPQRGLDLQLHVRPYAVTLMPATARPTQAGLMRALRQLGVVLVLAFSVLRLISAIGDQRHWMFDFNGGLYNAGQAILNGQNPYHPAFISHQAAIMRGGGMAIGETAAHPFSLPLYPAPANLAVVPLSLLPAWLAGALFTLLGAAALPLALRLLEVRDRRCYALALISWPFVYGLELGTLGSLLVLGAAVIWRWRNRLWPPAIALASIVVAKVFPFPLAIWMFATRRYRALTLAVILGVTMTVAAWAILGFAGMSEYPKMLADASFIQQGRSDSLVAILLAAGVPSGAAQKLTLVAAAALLGLTWRLARSQTPGADRRAFGLAVIAGLTASPIVWDHYLVLLFVPVALLSPRLSTLWLLPLAGPVLLALSAVVFPSAHRAALSPGNLRGAVITVGLEAVLTLRLVRPATQPVALPSLRSAAQPAGRS